MPSSNPQGGKQVPEEAVTAAAEAFERLPNDTQFRERLTQLPEYGETVVPPRDLARTMLEAAATFLTQPLSERLKEVERQRDEVEARCKLAADLHETAVARADQAKAALADRDRQVREALTKLGNELNGSSSDLLSRRDEEAARTERARRLEDRAGAYREAADQVQATLDSLALTQPSSNPPQQDREVGDDGRLRLTPEERERAEAEGAAAGQCPFCEGGMDAIAGVHTKDCPLTQPEADPEVPRWDDVDNYKRSDLAEEVIERLKKRETEAKETLDRLTAERDAKGGKKTDPATPAMLVAYTEKRIYREAILTVSDTDLERFFFGRSDCQSTPELLGEEVTADDCDEAARALFQYATKAGRSHERSVELLVVAQKFCAAAVRLTQPVSESPGDSGEGLTQEEKRAAVEALEASLATGWGSDNEGEAVPGISAFESALKKIRGSLTQPVPGNSGGVEEGRHSRIKGVEEPEVRVSVELDPDCIHGENVGEFHPKTVSAATAMLEQMLTKGSREHRDAGILAACVVAVSLHALIGEAQDEGGRS